MDKDKPIAYVLSAVVMLPVDRTHEVTDLPDDPMDVIRMIITGELPHAPDCDCVDRYTLGLGSWAAMPAVDDVLDVLDENLRDPTRRQPPAAAVAAVRAHLREHGLPPRPQRPGDDHETAQTIGNVEITAGAIALRVPARTAPHARSDDHSHPAEATMPAYTTTLGYGIDAAVLLPRGADEHTLHDHLLDAVASLMGPPDLRRPSEVGRDRRRYPVCLGCWTEMPTVEAIIAHLRDTFPDRESRLASAVEGMLVRHLQVYGLPAPPTEAGEPHQSMMTVGAVTVCVRGGLLHAPVAEPEPATPET